MKIAVLGAGAIGALVAAYLKESGEDVLLVGRRDSVEAIRRNGIFISGVRGEHRIQMEISEKLDSEVDLVILAVKTQDIEEVVKNNLEALKDTTVLTTQNGVQAERILSRYLAPEEIISSIVMFGSTYVAADKIVHNFEGKWILGRLFYGEGCRITDVSKVLGKAFAVVLSENILGMKYLKLFVNANNCLAALLGKSMQETFKNLEVCRISMGIWREGLKIIDKAKINLESLPDFPLERLRSLASLPLDESAKIFCAIMTGLSKEPLYGSILQSIQRKRDSEIDYINGEFVNIARSINETAALNSKLVEMVHEVERTQRFFTEEELINSTKGLLR